MSTKIYSNGCLSCGKIGLLMMKVKAKTNATIINSRFDEQAQQEHLSYLRQAGIDTGQYHPIVVENEGEVITLLKEWK